MFDENAFGFLARNYKTPPVIPKQETEWNLHEIFTALLEHNATVAACVGQHRLAQSWRILSLAVTKELKTRAEANRDLRMSGKRLLPKSSGSKQSRELYSPRDNDSKLGENILHNNLAAPSAQENSSNMTTPLARPISELSIDADKASNIPAVDQEPFRLPLPAFAKQSPKKHHAVSDLARLKNLHDTRSPDQGLQTDPESSISPILKAVTTSKSPTQVPLVPGFLDLDHQMSERRAAMSNYRAQPRPLLMLDDPFYIPRDGLLQAPSLGRHDSNESFQMFSGSTDSSQRAASMGASFGSAHGSEKSGSSPERLRKADRVRSGELNEATPEMLFEDDESRLAAGNYSSLAHGSADQMGFTASQQRVAASPPALMRPLDPQPPILHHEDVQTANGPITPADEGISSSKAYFIPSDFDQLDEALPTKPWNATAMLSQLITYHMTLCDSQTPAYLLLYFVPYFSLSMTPLRIASILLSYHNRLVSLSLHTQAAHLRNLCYPAYPQVYDHGTYGITSGGAWCTICCKPNKGDRHGYCERCNNTWAPCPICNGDGPIALRRPVNDDDDTYTDLHNPSASDALWGWCQSCGHGGHVGCLRVWWADATISEGGCANMGCLHDCVAGIRRDERLEKAAREKRAGTVQGDDWFVGESRAAEKARDLLGAGNTRRDGRRKQGQGQTSAGGIGGAQGVLSAGLGGRSNSGSGGGKKVRLVVPEGNGEEEVAETNDVTSASAP